MVIEYIYYTQNYQFLKSSVDGIWKTYHVCETTNYFSLKQDFIALKGQTFLKLKLKFGFYKTVPKLWLVSTWLQSATDFCGWIKSSWK